MNGWQKKCVRNIIDIKATRASLNRVPSLLSLNELVLLALKIKFNSFFVLSWHDCWWQRNFLFFYSVCLLRLRRLSGFYSSCRFSSRRRTYHDVKMKMFEMFLFPIAVFSQKFPLLLFGEKLLFSSPFRSRDEGHELMIFEMEFTWFRNQTWVWCS